MNTLGRPAVKTHRVPLDVSQPLIALFGTVPNAHTRLKLRGAVSSLDFGRAMRGDPVTEETADLITDACRAWLRQWILGVAQGFKRELTFDLASDEEEKAWLANFPRKK